MLKISIPKEQDKIIKQINALKWQLDRDTNEEDKIIHMQALKELEQALKQVYEEVDNKCLLLSIFFLYYYSHMGGNLQ